MTPHDLDRHPELAVLSVLASALEAANCALISVHPHLRDADPDYADEADAPSAGIAHCLILMAGSLRETISSYKRATTRDDQWALIRSHRADPRI